MELRHIRYFVAVAESGSVSTAARSRLHTSQPSLSRQLLELEEELGVKLFERRSRGVVLTDPGLVFLERSRRVLKEVDDAAAAARNTPAVLRLGVLPGLELSTLPRVVELARKHSPEAEIRVMSASSPRLIEELRAGNIDMAFMRQDEDAVDIHFEIAGYHGLTAFLRDDHALAAKPELVFEDLIDQTYVSVGRRSAPALRVAIDAWAQRKDLPLRPVHTAANIASALSLILTVGGFSLLPKYADQLLLPRVITRPLVDGPSPIPLMIGDRPKNASRSRHLMEAVRKGWRA